MPWNINTKISEHYVANYMFPGGAGAATYPVPQSSDRQELIAYIQNYLSIVIDEGQAIERNNATNPYALPADLLVRGWAAAGVWYNRIADMNGTFTTAAANLPKVSLYPSTMMYLAV